MVKTTFFTKLFITLSFLLFSLFGISQTIATDNTPTISGTETFTVPAGVTSITVEVWGAGGAGGARTNLNAAAGGGSGGAYSSSVLSVSPGANINYFVGAGTPSVIGGVVGSPGEDSWFQSNTTVMAKGGNSGVDNTNNVAGALASAGFGTIKYSGGRSGSSGSTNGGGGGSSAGIGANGNYTGSSTNSAGATAPTDGGNGGNGRTTSEGPGLAGSTPGGGGGGSRNGTIQQASGAGGNGRVRITYTAALPPEINIQGNLTNITDGDTGYSVTNRTDFGSTNAGTGITGVTYTYTIENTGTGSLTLGTIILGDPTNYSYTNPVSTTVSAGGTTTFTITFNPTTAGVKNSTFSIVTNDSDENPYNFAVTGTGLAAPEINIKGNAVIIADGNSTPSTGDWTDFGSTTIGVGVIKTYTVTNTGTAALTLGTITLGDTTNYSSTTPLSTSLAGGSSTTFTVTFNPTTTGIKNTTFSIVTNDSDENPYNYSITGTGALSAPEIDIRGNTVTIVDGDSTPSTADWTDFGSSDVGVGITKTFTIYNTGTQTLNIGTISFSGTNASDFSITTAPTATVAAAGNTTFVVTFTPSGYTVESAAISIATNDSDENPYNFSIQGTGYSGPKLEVYGGTILTTSTTPTTPAVTTTSAANMIASGTTSTNSFTDFGNLSSGNMLIKSYILKNIGTYTLPSVHTNDLVFSSATAVTLSGANANQFSVTKNIIINAKANSYATLLDETLAPQTYTTIDIAFKPTSTGIKTATVNISLSTGSPATYTFTITGTGTTAVASPFTMTKVPTAIDNTLDFPSATNRQSTFNYPYVIIYGPDDYLWVTERVRETISRVNKTTGAIDQIADLSSVVWRNGGQDGLLGMALHPNLGKATGEDYVYVAYTYGSSDATRRLRIARYTYSVTANDGSLGSPVVLIENIPASNDHNSGKLLFGSDNKLYYTIGDQGNNQSGNACNENKAQVLPTVAQLTTASPVYTNYPGKIIRMNLDGTIPDDNPILNGVRSHIFTYGHRNPQGITFAKNGKIYSNEHGPNSDDELNILKSGGNYGWPRINGFKDDKNYTYYPWYTDGGCGSYSNLYFPTPNFKESEWTGTFNPPIATLYTVDNGYNPSGSTLTYTTIAPSCAKMYEGFASEIPGWNNSILMSSLKNGRVYRQKLSPDGSSILGEPEELFFSDNRYRDIALDPDGKTIYIITDNSGKTSFPGGSTDSTMANPGQILKFTYGTPDMLTCTAPVPDTPTLPTISDSCSVILTAPTASNNCSGVGGIVGLTDTVFPITKQGTTTVIWKYLYGNGQIVTQNQDVTISSTTWNGSTWTNGLPTGKAALITGNLTISSDLSACSLTVNNNAVVTVNTGVNVTLNGSLTVSSGSFTLNNNANLIQTTDVNNTGNIIVKRNSSSLMRLDYTLWSSPVTNQKLSIFSPMTSVAPSRFYTYDTPTNVYDDIASPSTTNFNSGQGYLIRMPNNHPTTPTVWNGTFIGVPNNGYYPITMVNSGVGKRYNFVGNPYPSPINMTQFVLENNTKITGTLYFWRKTNGALGSGYCTWAGGTFVTNSQAQVVNPVGVIQTGQGFFVEAINSSTSIQFNNTQRVANTTGQFFKTKESKQSTDDDERNTIWVNATSTSGAFSQMAVGYITDATQGVDSFDGRHFNDGDVALNSVLNDEDYVIQGRALPFSETDVVPLSFRTKNSDNYTISLDHVDGLFSGNQDIILKDNVTGTETNLKTDSYTFTAPAGSDKARFSLKYQKTLGTDSPVVNENNIAVYKNKGAIQIKSEVETIDNVKLYDTKGTLLFEKTKVNTKETSIDSSKFGNQILILKITSSDKKIATKKIVN
ncbi:MAG: glucose/sorbosone family PQQ-dependent dehydrogenase [Bacteroidota bacterium]